MVQLFQNIYKKKNLTIGAEALFSSLALILGEVYCITEQGTQLHSRECR